jgi:hypothetical protein
MDLRGRKKEDWRKLHTEELQVDDFYSSLKFSSVTSSMREKINIQSVVIGQLDMKKPLWKIKA